MRIRWRFQLRRVPTLMLLFVVVFNFVFFVCVYHEFIVSQPSKDRQQYTVDQQGKQRHAVRHAAVAAATEATGLRWAASKDPVRPLPPIPKSSSCDGLATLGPTLEKFTFQSVSSKNDDNYVFSAFYDHRNAIHPVVRVIGLSANLRNLYCQFSYPHRDRILISEANVETIFGGHGRRYESVMFTCAVPDTSHVPHSVSLTTTRCTKSPTNLLAVVSPSAASTVVDFVVCVTPLNYKFDRYMQLTEIVEVNRLFGADKLVFYNYSSGSQVSTYLRRMKHDGLVEVVPWPLPMPVDMWPPVQGHVPQVHYFAQLAALNDCLYRHMFSADHIVFTDMDEVIVPRPPHNNWQSLLKDLRSKLNHQPAMFMFRNAFFWLEWPNNPKYAAIDKVTRLNLTTLLKTRRERTILPYGQRSKCIVAPLRVNHMGVHEVNDYSDGMESKVFVDPSFGLLHHYRVDLGGGVNSPYVTDTRMADFADQIIDWTWRRHKSIVDRR